MPAKCAIIFAPEWPGEHSGYQIALKSSLQFFLKQYQQVAYLALTDRDSPASLNQFDSNVSFTPIPISKRSIKTRFAKSLLGRAPAVCSAFLENRVLSQVDSVVGKVASEQGDSDLIFEDVPICSLLTKSKSLAKTGNHTTLRSHNVLTEAFGGFTQDPHPIKRAAWKFELGKIRRFEKMALGLVDQTLAITNRDRQLYDEIFPGHHVGWLPIGFDNHFFESTLIDNTSASESTVISLGSMDLRKAHGMEWFVNSCFRDQNDTGTKMELILGGRGTDRFHDPANMIQGRGFVADESEFMKLGRSFINPQKYGSGVKLKSLVAMAYGKCLISTSKGVEGINATPGTHFLLADTVDVMKDVLQGIRTGDINTLEIGINARRFVMDQYQQSQIAISK